MERNLSAKHVRGSLVRLLSADLIGIQKFSAKFAQDLSKIRSNRDSDSSDAIIQIATNYVQLAFQFTIGEAAADAPESAERKQRAFRLGTDARIPVAERISHAFPINELEIRMKGRTIATGSRSAMREDGPDEASNFNVLKPRSKGPPLLPPGR